MQQILKASGKYSFFLAIDELDKSGEHLEDVLSFISCSFAGISPVANDLGFFFVGSALGITEVHTAARRPVEVRIHL